jgi:hypothetical protein
MENIEKCLHKIADDLTHSDNIPYFNGLFYGKTGIALFLYNYYKYTKNRKYEDFASNLLDMVVPHLLNKMIPINYPYGLCGIGAGIEYLVQNGFIGADTDDILSDYDSIVSHYLSHPILLSSLNQIFGIGKYLSFRMMKSKKKEMLKDLIENVMKLIEFQFLREPVCSSDTYLFLNMLKNHSENAEFLLDKYFSDYNQMENPRINSNSDFNIHDIIINIATGHINDKKFKEEAITLLLKNSNTDNLGFLEGKAGIGMILLSLSGKIDSNWVQLLGTVNHSGWICC